MVVVRYADDLVAGFERHRVCLTKLSTHRNTGELVDRKALLEGAYSVDQRSAVRCIGDRTPDDWSDGASLTVVLLLSLGVWAALWEAVGLLASAVLG
jgi:hypothetical protein